MMLRIAAVCFAVVIAATLLVVGFWTLGLPFLAWWCAASVVLAVLWAVVRRGAREHETERLGRESARAFARQFNAKQAELAERRRELRGRA